MLSDYFPLPMTLVERVRVAWFRFPRRWRNAFRCAPEAGSVQMRSSMSHHFIAHLVDSAMMLQMRLPAEGRRSRLPKIWKIVDPNDLSWSIRGD